MKRARLLVLSLMMVTTWLAPSLAHADVKLATLTVKGMVCQA